MHCSAPVLLLVAAAVAQEAAPPLELGAVRIDSGYLANAGTAAAVVWSCDVPAGGDWVQLHFADTNLPPGSRLRVAGSGRPDLAQWHDADSLRDYRGWTCHLLGPAARVELVAGPGTAGNRALVDGWQALTFGGADTLCDGADDRVLSADPRACRLDANCSAWLFSPYAVCTAGHCVTATAGRILHFNVPLSDQGGTPQPAHPNDQYALDAFLQRLDAGIGQDWTVMAAVRNSNTGLFPGQAQGSWYDVANPPAAAAGNVRITGYGTGNGTSGSATWNQAQKTHAGPRVPVAEADALGYRTDTTSGNSGSPVIHEASGAVIGVHTNGGCGQGSGNNFGTSAARADWTAARQAAAALHVVGSLSTYGTGCGGAAGVPALALAGVPECGRSFTVHVANLNPAPGLFGSLVIGFDAATWSGGALPASLAPRGLEGCTLYVRPDVADTLPSSGGIAQRNYVLPGAAVLVGTRAYLQYFALDPTAANTAHAVASNAGDVFVGS